MQHNSVGGRFLQADLKARWKGTAKNQSVHFDLILYADSHGNVFGSGHKAKWSITVNGIVKGGGPFTFVDEGRHIIAYSMWRLIMNTERNKLEGDLHIRNKKFNEMKVELVKIKE